MKISNEQNINKTKTNIPGIKNNKEEFNSFNIEVLNEINYAREKPEEYILKLQDIKDNLSSKNEKFLYIDNIPYIYQNLFSSLENSITFLKTQKRLAKLISIPQLSSACEQLKKEIISKKKDNRSDNIKFKERINKYGNTFGENYEIIGYNLLDPEFIVLNLILGDGDYSKLGRKIIFNPNIKYIGIEAHFGDSLYNDKFHILIFSEDFCDISKKDESIINKYKNKNPNYTSKSIYYKIREEYLEKQDDTKINNIINSAKKNKNKSNIKYTSEKHHHKHKHKKNYKSYFDENNSKIKNDLYFNYYTHANKLYFDEDELFEKEFDQKWGKMEKDKNFQKKIFTTSTTSQNGENITIISEIFENVQNGVKKGYFTEQKNYKNYDKNWKNENAEKEKRDITILKNMEMKERERMNNINKSNKKNISQFGLDTNEEIPEGVVDIKVERKNIIDSNGKPAVEVKKTLTYEDGSVQNIIRIEAANEE
jgi:hypothetical protein